MKTYKAKKMNAHIRNIDEHGTFIRDNYKDNSKLKL
jgi:hypothetical protein